MMFFKLFGLRKAGNTKKHPRRRDDRLGLERLEEKSLLAVVLPNLPVGSQYQLVVATSLTTSGDHADIAYFNNLASIAGANVSGVPTATWSAWCSTPKTNAADNVALFVSVPLYNTQGQLVASGKTSFLSPVHQAPILSETGDPLSGKGLVWTGSNYAGLGLGSASLGYNNGFGAYYGVGQSGNYTTDGLWASSGNDWNAFVHGIYIVSSVLTAGSTATTPTAPTSLVGTPGNSQVSLSWTAPTNNGGSPITDYTIQYSSTGTAPWTTFPHSASTATSATVTGLTNGTSYVFRVAALNAAGIGSWSANSSAVIPRTVPAAPTNVIGSPGNSQVTVNWTAPTDNGGSPITDYTIQYSSTGTAPWTTFSHTASTATTATVAGLTNGTSYVFRVAAVNAAGTGSWSVNSSAVIPRTVPAAPTTVIGSPGNTQVTVNWTAPTDNGGNPITDYTIQYSSTGTDPWTNFSHTASTATTATVTGLTNGTSYVFRVAAVNAAGTGGWSTNLVPVIPTRDKICPYVVSMSVVGPNPTNATSLSYSVRFSEIVEGVDATDFMPTTSGVSAAIPCVVTGSGRDYTVTINNITGSGTVALRLLDDRTIHDLAGNPLTSQQVGGGFFPQSQFNTGYNPTFLDIGDINGDGNLDVVVTNSAQDAFSYQKAEAGGNSVCLLLGNGDGAFESASFMPVGKEPRGIKLGDLNDDGKLDMVVANQGDNTIYVMLGNGDGTFHAQISLAANKSPFAIALSDLNSDGSTDITVVDSLAGSVDVFLGHGDGSFSPRTTEATGRNPFFMAVGDLNQDGKQDIVVADQGSDSISLLRGKGDGTFLPRVILDGGTTPGAIGLGDYNGDGFLDIACTNWDLSITVSILLAQGDGTFRSRTTFATGHEPFGIAVGDVNSDGISDLVIGNFRGTDTNSDDSSVSVLLGLGDGTFGPQHKFAIGSYPVQLSVADLNHDGRLDVVVTNAALGFNENGTFIGSISVLLNSFHGDFTGDEVVVDQALAPPMSLIGVPGSGQVSLSWTAPSSNGSSAITDYSIQYSTNGGGSWTTFPHSASTATTATVTGLTNGTSYVLRVAAVNAAGTGSWSNPVTVIPRTVPTAPRSLIGIPGNGQVSLSWTAPSSDGGSPITDYSIQYSTNSGGSWNNYVHLPSTATTATVIGLTNGTSYVFRVAAVNAAGTDSWSNPITVILPTVPATPISLIGIPGNGQVSLSWTAPSSNGGSPITDYTIQYSSTGTAPWTTFPHSASTATSATVTGLTNGTSYVFQVAAVNAAGTGSWSSPVTVIPRTVATAPTSLIGTAGNGQVSLSWTAPTDNGGSAVTDYTIQYSTNGGATWTTFPHTASTATIATVAGLTNGTSYVFQVAAVNDAGTGAFSDPTPRATPLPAVPGRPTAAAVNGFVVLRWVASRLVRMPPITDYAIRYSSNNGSTWTLYPHVASAATSRRLILTNGNTYIFQVAPVVSGGVGVYSARSLPVTPFSPAAKPDAPSGVVGVKTVALISLSWNPVPRNAGGPVIDYLVQYRVNTPKARWLSYPDGVSSATSANLRLRAGYSYVFRVAAKNLAGVGAFSAQSAPVPLFLASITQPPSSPPQISSVYPRPTQRADR